MGKLRGDINVGKNYEVFEFFRNKLDIYSFHLTNQEQILQRVQ